MFPTPQVRRASLEQRFPGWTPRTIAGALDQAVASYGDRDLFLNEQGRFSYRDIQAWSRRLASGLIEWGVAPGDHVAMIMANHAEFVAMKFAIARVGAVLIPVNFHLRGDELIYVLDQSDAVLIVAMERFRGHDYLADLDSNAPGWRDGPCPALPKVRELFVLPAEDSPAGVRTVADLASLGNEASDRELVRREKAADPDSTSDILYTSGTTGQPKGVMLSHDMVLRAAYASVYHRAFEDGRRIAHALPMYHVFGYVECLMAVLFVGGAIVSNLVFDPETLLESAEKERASDIICLPNMTLKMLELVRTRGFDSSHLVAVFNSGGVNPPSIWEDIRALLRPLELVTGYGMSETTASTTCTLPEDDDSRLLDSNGRFKLAHVAGTQDAGGFTAIYKAVDPESGADLPAGEVGELLVRGPIVTKGYYKKPAETAAAFTADGWLRTGDLGRVTGDGYLTLTGRIKESYRCGGEMVMPREIEALVESHPLVAQALAIGVPDMKMGEVGCLCIVASEGARPDPGELLALCAARLARFKVPRHVLFFRPDEIPVTATGRPQKVRLVDIATDRLAGAGAARLA
jgi:fatty-acyl-CoA synthase